MDVGFKKFSFGAPLSASISALSDEDDDGLALPHVAEDDTYEIPLKTSFFQNSNFSELNDELESLRSPPNNIMISKKVRFEPSSNGDEGQAVANEAPHDTIRGKRNVEDLLQYANQVNEYLAQNLEKINTFRSDLLSDSLPHNTSSDMATQATTLSASMSNFELSDNEYEDQYSNGDRMSLDPLNDGKNASSLNKDEKALLDTLPSAETSGSIDAEFDKGFGYETDNNSSLDQLIDGNNDYTLENSPALAPKKLGSDLISMELNENIKHLMINTPQHIREDTHDEQNGGASLIIADISSSGELSDLSVEQGIELFQETIGFILQMSQMHSNEHPDNVLNKSNEALTNDNDPNDSNEFSSFVMKSTPSLTYKQLISRIQAKCMFSPIVYLTSSFLLLTLLLTRDFPNGPILLRHRLDEAEIHRLVIAAVRIATKLLEDCVHSHQYFCKVCGVSKKLLTRLEASLIICLKEDALIITTEKLSASIKVGDELKRRSIEQC